MNSKTFKQQVLPLAERIYPMVARMLNEQESAEDVVQDIMMKLWQDRQKVAAHPNIKALVFTTARNHCIDRLRRKQLAIQPYDAAIHDQRPGNNGHVVEKNELDELIQTVLQEMPEKQAAVLMYRDLDQLEFAEIATIMGLKVENIRMLLSRARKKMAEKLSMIYNYESKESRSAGA